jgi:hypothetical protein
MGKLNVIAKNIAARAINEEGKRILPKYFFLSDLYTTTPIPVSAAIRPIIRNVSPLPSLI